MSSKDKKSVKNRAEATICLNPYFKKMKNYVIIFFLLVATQTAFAQAKNNNDDRIYTFVEQKPEFPGGEKALLQYLANNIKYPAEAREEGFEGKMFLEFVVEKDGSISNIKNRRSKTDTASVMDKEYLRVIQNMPKWTAGKQNGKAVRVRYILPVQICLD